MGFKRLRRHCEQRLRDIEVPQPFSVDAFRESLADQRGRAVHLHPLPGSGETGSPCGAWVSTAEADHVFYEPATSPLHREHIICHELAHMLCGHRMPSDTQGMDPQELLPHLDPALVHHMLARTSYTAEQEQEAEMLASMILEHAGRSPASPPGDVEPEVAPVLDRIEQALGPDRVRSRG